MNKSAVALTSEEAVYQRYAAAAKEVEPALCCAVSFDPKLLQAIPEEIIQRDYGCGDPSPYVQSGETILDLGAGGGKLCFIASQLVGATGKVIGVDCNQEMLSLAKKHQQTVAERIGYANVDFRYGMIQDLKLNLALLDQELQAHPVNSAEAYLSLRQLEERLRQDHPLISDSSIDCVVSNCVLNLVRQQDRRQLFQEIYRVLRPGGRAAISDIVSNVYVPDDLQRDPKLWSGCISGAFQQEQFLRAFIEVGFPKVEVAKLSEEPWQVVDGIEFRSMTVVAYKSEKTPSLKMLPIADCCSSDGKCC